jgi:hypothetical protein
MRKYSASKINLVGRAAAVFLSHFFYSAENAGLCKLDFLPRYSSCASTLSLLLPLFYNPGRRSFDADYHEAVSLVFKCSGVALTKSACAKLKFRAT